MKLNNYSYAHKQIRLLLYQLEILSKMKLTTDVGEEFDQIRLVNSLGYIIIDYKKQACFTLSHNMSNKEWSAVQDILLYLRWLDTGLKFQEERLKRNVPKR